MRVHDLKISPRWFADVHAGSKGFEVRRDDRDFHVGDRLRLREYADGEYTGRGMTVSVDYILRHDDFPEGIMPGYCILQFGGYFGRPEPLGECNTTTNGRGME